MKKSIILLLGLLPLMLSAQIPQPPFTPQEAIAMMPKLPTLDGMLAHALGYVDFRYTDKYYTDDYSDNSDLSRFMAEYKIAMASYESANDKYSNDLTAFSLASSSKAADAQMNETIDMLGVSPEDFSKMSKKDQEALGKAYVNTQIATMGIGDVDIDKVSKMSEKEAEAYLNKQMSNTSGISEKELAKMEKMSDKELEAYLQRPENRGTMEALMKMAGNVPPSQQNAMHEESITVEEIMEIIKRDILSKTIRLQDLTVRRDKMAQDLDFVTLSEISKQTEVMAVLQAYMTAGEQFYRYPIPEFYKYTEE